MTGFTLWARYVLWFLAVLPLVDEKTVERRAGNNQTDKTLKGLRLIRDENDLVDDFSKTATVEARVTLSIDVTVLAS